MKLPKFMKLVDLNWNDVRVVPDSQIFLDYEFDISPEQFLEFAKKDIENSGKHALVNALSNSKRAIDCQVDKILHCFGINAKRQNFPAKLELLQELGVVAPRIVGKVVQERNYLEHEYKCPKKGQVKDFIDITTLFLEASSATLHNFYNSFIVGDKKNMFDDEERFKRCIFFNFDPDNKKFELSGYKNGASIGSIRIKSVDKEYLTIIKLAISISIGKEEAFRSSSNIFLKM